LYSFVVLCETNILRLVSQNLDNFYQIQTKCYRNSDTVFFFPIRRTKGGLGAGRHRDHHCLLDAQASSSASRADAQELSSVERAPSHGGWGHLKVARCGDGRRVLLRGEDRRQRRWRDTGAERKRRYPHRPDVWACARVICIRRARMRPYICTGGVSVEQ
jgi:hypothetical protein